MTYLLDTDTCIYWLKNRFSVKEKIREVGWNQIAISVITAAELYYGAYNSNRVPENLIRAEEFIKNLPVIPLSNHSIKIFGELKAELRKSGQLIGDFDLLIASIALTNNYILVTNNTRHYNRITGLTLENWVLS